MSRISMNQRYTPKRHRCASNETMQAQREKKGAYQVAEIEERKIKDPEKPREKIFKQKDMANS